MAVISENDKGRLEFVNDELLITSKTSDAGALRFQSHNEIIGKISWDDGNGCERFILTGDLGDGIKFQGNPSGNSQDGDMLRMMSVKWDGVRYDVPVFGASGGSGGGAPMTGRVALRSCANGRFVCAEGAGTAPLMANRDGIGEWEAFEVIPC